MTQVGTVATKHGVSDWEANKSTYTGIGAGLADAKVTSAELDGYKATIATTEEQAKWMQEGYDAAK